MNKDLRYNYTALLICAVACCAWSYVLDLKYLRLGYTSWDLPLYANLMWNLCHGNMSTSLFEGNFLTDHFNVIAFLLAPFYFFFQSALTMLYFKLFAFFTGAYIFYLLSLKRLGGVWAIAFMLAYLFYPANVTMIFFEFNFENLALPMIFLIFYFFEEKRYSSFMLCCLLLTMVKENMPLVVFMFGIYGFMTRKEDWLRWGLYPLILGGGMFIGAFFIFTPLLRYYQGLHMVNVHIGLYSNLGKSPWDIARTFIFNEPKVLQILFNSRNLIFLLQLFGPLLVWSLLSPRILLIASPLFLQDLLSEFSGQQSIYYYYSSTLTVFIFMATIVFLGRINFKFKGYLLFIIIISLFAYDISYVPQWRQRVPSFDEKQAVSQYLISQIPSDAKVVSSYKFLNMLSQRKDLYVLFLRPNKGTQRKKIIPDTVDYMAADFAPTWGKHKDYVEMVLSQGPWKVQAAADEDVLLKKNAVGGEMLIKSGEHSFLKSKLGRPVIMLGDALRVEGLDTPASLKFGQRIMRVGYYWEALKDDMNQTLPQIYLSIFQGDRRFYFKSRTPFYGLPLDKGRYYKEVFYYLIPQLSPGRYSIIISSNPSMTLPTSPALFDNGCIKDLSVVLIAYTQT